MTETAARISFGTMLISLFLTSSAYTVFLAAASEFEWPIASWILENDDRLVGVLSYFIPLLHRYRAWMTANDFTSNVELMENVYSICWLFFIVWSLASVPLLAKWADTAAEHRKSSGTSLRTVTTASNFIIALLGASLWLGFYGDLDFAEHRSRALLVERIHVNKWYAARASLLTSWSYWALFLSLTTGMSAKRTKFRS